MSSSKTSLENYFFDKSGMQIEGIEIAIKLAQKITTVIDREIKSGTSEVQLKALLGSLGMSLITDLRFEKKMGSFPIDTGSFMAKRARRYESNKLTSNDGVELYLNDRAVSLTSKAIALLEEVESELFPALIDAYNLGYSPFEIHFALIPDFSSIIHSQAMANRFRDEREELAALDQKQTASPGSEKTQ